MEIIQKHNFKNQKRQKFDFAIRKKWNTLKAQDKKLTYGLEAVVPLKSLWAFIPSIKEKERKNMQNMYKTCGS